MYARTSVRDILTKLELISARHIARVTRSHQRFHQYEKIRQNESAARALTHAMAFLCKEQLIYAEERRTRHLRRARLALNKCNSTRFPSTPRSAGLLLHEAFSPSIQDQEQGGICVLNCPRRPGSGPARRSIPRQLSDIVLRQQPRTSSGFSCTS